MVTRNQLTKFFFSQYLVKRKYKFLPLNQGPQRKSVAFELVTRTPKKPNSANRAAIRSQYNRKKLFIHISGEGGHSLSKFSSLLIYGSRVRDLPQVHSRGLRGKLDLKYVINRATSRSKYGRKHPRERSVLKVVTRVKKSRKEKKMASPQTRVVKGKTRRQTLVWHVLTESFAL